MATQQYAAKDLETLQRYDYFVEAARQTGREVLVSFGHTRGNSNYLPTLDQYKQAVTAFHNRFGGVLLFTAWNEPNHTDQPTSVAQSGSLEGARQAGRYFRTLRRLCKTWGCTVAAGDFLDGTLKKDYLAEYKYGAYRAIANTPNPEIWAFHAYSSGSQNTEKYLRSFLTATTAACDGCTSAPRVWLTEQGGLVSKYGESKAASHLANLLRLPAVSDRITRFYYYSWKGNIPGFDSGLVHAQTDMIRAALYDQYKAKSNPSVSP